MTWTTRQRSDLGGGLAAIRAVSGRLVILLHGVGLRSEAWAPQIDALSTRFGVLAIDLPGHGGSTAQGEASVTDFARRIAGALDAPAVVIGHSMGAMIAAELARLHPDRVTGIGCLNAIHRRAAAAKQAVQARAASLDGVTCPAPGPTLGRWFGTSDTPQRRACQDWLTAVPPNGYRAAYRAFAQADGPKDAALRALSAPALFMTGAEEPNSTQPCHAGWPVLPRKARRRSWPGRRI